MGSDLRPGRHRRTRPGKAGGAGSARRLRPGAARELRKDAVHEPDEPRYPHAAERDTRNVHDSAGAHQRRRPGQRLPRKNTDLRTSAPGDNQQRPRPFGDRERKNHSCQRAVRPEGVHRRHRRYDTHADRQEASALRRGDLRGDKLFGDRRPDEAAAASYEHTQQRREIHPGRRRDTPLREGAESRPPRRVPLSFHSEG